MIRRSDLRLAIPDKLAAAERRARSHSRARHRVRTERAGEIAEAIDLLRRDRAAFEPDDRHPRADLLLLRAVLEAEQR
jgi:hypothetical protein